MAKHPGKCPRCGSRLDVESAADERILCPGCHSLLILPGKRKASDPVDPLIGQTLGDFQVLELLGRGGMASVYRATQTTLGRPVAVKVLPRALSADQKLVDRFRREAKVAAAVSHPNIVEVYSIGEARGYRYIAMEYADSGSLEALLREEGRLPADCVLDVLRQVAAALAEAHSCGVLHRDIKPSNILLTTQGLVKVADFGLAKRPGVDVTITAAGAAIGTPNYFAPEAARGLPLDGRSDLYSLGATAYHCLAGRPPFEGTTIAEFVIHHTESPVVPLSRLAPDVPPALARIVHRLLAKRPADRYQSARELLDALGEAEARLDGGEPSPGQPPSPAGHGAPEERAARKGRQARRGALAAAACVLLSLAVAAVLLLGRSRDRGDVPKEPAPERPAPQPKEAQPRPPAWQVAWQEAEARAKALVAEQRFADAISVYETAASNAEDPVVQELLSKAMLAVSDQANAAAQEAETRARQLAGERKFDEARAALRPALERHGIPGKKERAHDLLAEIDKAERELPPLAAGEWYPLLHGGSLRGWRVPEKLSGMPDEEPADPGWVHVADGQVVLEPQGQGLRAAIAYDWDFPRQDYEVELEAMRVAGFRDLCLVCFPVGPAACCLSVGGLHNDLVGLMLVDGRMADNNETRRDLRFENGTWYRVRLRVTRARVEAWIDDERVIDLATERHQLSPYPYTRLVAPFGVAASSRKTLLRNIRLQRF